MARKRAFDTINPTMTKWRRDTPARAKEIACTVKYRKT